ncbi:MAG: PD-(D/E)XK nuclease family protein, partial [Pseudomonadota bacterium]
ITPAERRPPPSDPRLSVERIGRYRRRGRAASEPLSMHTLYGYPATGSLVIEAALIRLKTKHPDKVSSAKHPMIDGETLSFSLGTKQQAADETAPTDRQKIELPLWIKSPAPADAPPLYPITPSQIGWPEPAVRSPLARETETPKRRGTVLHKLLERLPHMATETRPEFIKRFLALHLNEASENERALLADEVQTLIADPEIAFLFAEDGKSEVPMVGHVGHLAVRGQVDRLIVRPHEVVIVDYKTNRAPPKSLQTVPRAYCEQMAAYEALARSLYPDRTIRTGLLWTARPALMWLPAEGLSHHLNTLIKAATP